MEVGCAGIFETAPGRIRTSGLSLSVLMSARYQWTNLVTPPEAIQAVGERTDGTIPGLIYTNIDRTLEAIETSTSLSLAAF